MSEEGFTFVEVIAASFIAAMALVVLFNALSLNLNRMGILERDRELALVAEDRIERVGLGFPLRESVRTGVTESGILWAIAIGPIQGEANDSEAYQAYNVRVRTGWSASDLETRPFELNTVRLESRTEVAR